jgi:Bacterial Ig-like domain (group 2)
LDGRLIDVHHSIYLHRFDHQPSSLGFALEMLIASRDFMLQGGFMNIRFFGIAAIFALTLTACPNTSSVVSSVVVSGVTTPLKLGSTAALTAKAFDQSSLEMTGQTFTWTSSNPEIASVDANGIVTAKRLGNAKIGATSSNIKGEITLQTFGLEVVGGTYTASDGVLGTAVTYKAIGTDGNPPPAGTGLKITGPSGWRPGKPPVQLTLSAPRAWGLQFTGLYKSVPVTGSYQAEMTINAQNFTTSFDIDATKTIAAITDVVKTSISATGLNATWTLPAKTFNFEVDVVEDPDTTYKLMLEQKVTTNNARFDTTLNPAKAYQLDVFSSDVDMSADNPTFPAQLNLAINFSRFSVAP